MVKFIFAITFSAPSAASGKINFLFGDETSIGLNKHNKALDESVLRENTLELNKPIKGKSITKWNFGASVKMHITINTIPACSQRTDRISLWACKCPT